MKFLVLISMLFFGSCASLNKTHKGYKQRDLQNMKSDLTYKSLTEIKAVLGEPVAEGSCKEGEYTLIYLSQDMGNVSFALDMANKKGNLKCTQLTLGKSKDGSEFTTGGYIFAMDLTMCDRFKIPDTRKCQKA